MASEADTSEAVLIKPREAEIEESTSTDCTTPGNDINTRDVPKVEAGLGPDFGKLEETGECLTHQIMEDIAIKGNGATSGSAKVACEDISKISEADLDFSVQDCAEKENPENRKQQQNTKELQGAGEMKEQLTAQLQLESGGEKDSEQERMLKQEVEIIPGQDIAVSATEERFEQTISGTQKGKEESSVSQENTDLASHIEVHPHAIVPEEEYEVISQSEKGESKEDELEARQEDELEEITSDNVHSSLAVQEEVDEVDEVPLDKPRDVFALSEATLQTQIGKEKNTEVAEKDKDNFNRIHNAVELEETILEVGGELEESRHPIFEEKSQNTSESTGKIEDIFPNNEKNYSENAVVNKIEDVCSEQLDQEGNTKEVETTSKEIVVETEEASSSEYQKNCQTASESVENMESIILNKEEDEFENAVVTKTEYSIPEKLDKEAGFMLEGASHSSSEEKLQKLKSSETIEEKIVSNQEDRFENAVVTQTEVSCPENLENQGAPTYSPETVKDTVTKEGLHKEDNEHTCLVENSEDMNINEKTDEQEGISEQQGEESSTFTDELAMKDHDKPFNEVSEYTERAALDEQTDFIKDGQQIKLGQETSVEQRGQGRASDKDRTEEENLLTGADLNEMSRSTEICNPDKKANELHTAPTSVQQIAKNEVKQQEEVPSLEPAEQVEVTERVLKTENEHKEEATEAANSMDFNILEGGMNEEATPVRVTFTSSTEVGSSSNIDEMEQEKISEMKMSEESTETERGDKEDSDRNLMDGINARDDNDKIVIEDSGARSSMPICSGHATLDQNSQGLNLEVTQEELLGGDESSFSEDCSNRRESRNQKVENGKVTIEKEKQISDETLQDMQQESEAGNMILSPQDNAEEKDMQMDNTEEQLTEDVHGTGTSAKEELNVTPEEDRNQAKNFSEENDKCLGIESTIHGTEKDDAGVDKNFDSSRVKDEISENADNENSAAEEYPKNENINEEDIPQESLAKDMISQNNKTEEKNAQIDISEEFTDNDHTEGSLSDSATEKITEGCEDDVKEAKELSQQKFENHSAVSKPVDTGHEDISIGSSTVIYDTSGEGEYSVLLRVEDETTDNGDNENSAVEPPKIENLVDKASTMSGSTISPDVSNEENNMQVEDVLQAPVAENIISQYSNTEEKNGEDTAEEFKGDEQVKGSLPASPEEKIAKGCTDYRKEDNELPGKKFENPSLTSKEVEMKHEDINIGSSIVKDERSAEGENENLSKLEDEINDNGDKTLTAIEKVSTMSRNAISEDKKECKKILMEDLPQEFVAANMISQCNISTEKVVQMKLISEESIDDTGTSHESPGKNIAKGYSDDRKEAKGLSEEKFENLSILSLSKEVKTEDISIDSSIAKHETTTEEESENLTTEEHPTEESIVVEPSPGIKRTISQDNDTEEEKMQLENVSQESSGENIVSDNKIEENRLQAEDTSKQFTGDDNVEGTSPEPPAAEGHIEDGKEGNELHTEKYENLCIVSKAEEKEHEDLVLESSKCEMNPQENDENLKPQEHPKDENQIEDRSSMAGIITSQCDSAEEEKLQSEDSTEQFTKDDHVKGTSTETPVKTIVESNVNDGKREKLKLHDHPKDENPIEDASSMEGNVISHCDSVEEEKAQLEDRIEQLTEDGHVTGTSIGTFDGKIVEGNANDGKDRKEHPEEKFEMQSIVSTTVDMDEDLGHDSSLMKYQMIAKGDNENLTEEASPDDGKKFEEASSAANFIISQDNKTEEKEMGMEGPNEKYSKENNSMDNLPVSLAEKKVENSTDDGQEAKEFTKEVTPMAHGNFSEEHTAIEEEHEDPGKHQNDDNIIGESSSEESTISQDNETEAKKIQLEDISQEPSGESSVSDNQTQEIQVQTEGTSKHFTGESVEGTSPEPPVAEGNMEDGKEENKLHTEKYENLCIVSKAEERVHEDLFLESSKCEMSPRENDKNLKLQEHPKDENQFEDGSSMAVNIISQRDSAEEEKLQLEDSTEQFTKDDHVTGTSTETHLEKIVESNTNGARDRKECPEEILEKKTLLSTAVETEEESPEDGRITEETSPAAKNTISQDEKTEVKELHTEGTSKEYTEENNITGTSPESLAEKKAETSTDDGHEQKELTEEVTTMAGESFTVGQTKGEGENEDLGLDSALSKHATITFEDNEEMIAEKNLEDQKLTKEASLSAGNTIAQDDIIDVKKIRMEDVPETMLEENLTSQVDKNEEKNTQIEDNSENLIKDDRATSISPGFPLQEVLKTSTNKKEEKEYREQKGENLSTESTEIKTELQIAKENDGNVTAEERVKDEITIDEASSAATNEVIQDDNTSEVVTEFLPTKSPDDGIVQNGLPEDDKEYKEQKCLNLSTESTEIETEHQITKENAMNVTAEESVKDETIINEASSAVTNEVTQDDNASEVVFEVLLPTNSSPNDGMEQKGLPEDKKGYNKQKCEKLSTESTEIETEFSVKEISGNVTAEESVKDKIIIDEASSALTNKVIQDDNASEVVEQFLPTNSSPHDGIVKKGLPADETGEATDAGKEINDKSEEHNEQNQKEETLEQSEEIVEEQRMTTQEHFEEECHPETSTESPNEKIVEPCTEGGSKVKELNEESNMQKAENHSIECSATGREHEDLGYDTSISKILKSNIVENKELSEQENPEKEKITEEASFSAGSPISLDDNIEEKMIQMENVAQEAVEGNTISQDDGTEEKNMQADDINQQLEGNHAMDTSAELPIETSIEASAIDGNGAKENTIEKCENLSIQSAHEEKELPTQKDAKEIIGSSSAIIIEHMHENTALDKAEQFLSKEGEGIGQTENDLPEDNPELTLDAVNKISQIATRNQIEEQHDQIQKEIIKQPSEILDQDKIEEETYQNDDNVIKEGVKDKDLKLPAEGYGESIEETSIAATDKLELDKDETRISLKTEEECSNPEEIIDDVPKEEKSEADSPDVEVKYDDAEKGTTIEEPSPRDGLFHDGKDAVNLSCKEEDNEKQQTDKATCEQTERIAEEVHQDPQTAEDKDILESSNKEVNLSSESVVQEIIQNSQEIELELNQEQEVRSIKEIDGATTGDQSRESAKKEVSEENVGKADEDKGIKEQNKELGSKSNVAEATEKEMVLETTTDDVEASSAAAAAEVAFTSAKNEGSFSSGENVDKGIQMSGKFTAEQAADEERKNVPDEATLSETTEETYMLGLSKKETVDPIKGVDDRTTEVKAVIEAPEAIHKEERGLQKEDESQISGAQMQVMSENNVEETLRENCDEKNDQVNIPSQETIASKFSEKEEVKATELAKQPSNFSATNNSDSLEDVDMVNHESRKDSVESEKNCKDFAILEESAPLTQTETVISGQDASVSMFSGSTQEVVEVQKPASAEKVKEDHQNEPSNPESSCLPADENLESNNLVEKHENEKASVDEETKGKLSKHPADSDEDDTTEECPRNDETTPVEETKTDLEVQYTIREENGNQVGIELDNEDKGKSSQDAAKNQSDVDDLQNEEMKTEISSESVQNEKQKATLSENITQIESLDIIETPNNKTEAIVAETSDKCDLPEEGSQSPKNTTKHENELENIESPNLVEKDNHDITAVIEEKFEKSCNYPAVSTNKDINEERPRNDEPTEETETNLEVQRTTNKGTNENQVAEDLTTTDQVLMELETEDIAKSIQEALENQSDADYLQQNEVAMETGNKDEATGIQEITEKQSDFNDLQHDQINTMISSESVQNENENTTNSDSITETESLDKMETPCYKSEASTVAETSEECDVSEERGQSPNNTTERDHELLEERIKGEAVQAGITEERSLQPTQGQEEDIKCLQTSSGNAGANIEIPAEDEAEQRKYVHIEAHGVAGEGSIEVNENPNVEKKDSDVIQDEITFESVAHANYQDVEEITQDETAAKHLSQPNEEEQLQQMLSQLIPVEEKQKASFEVTGEIAAYQKPLPNETEKQLQQQLSELALNEQEHKDSVLTEDIAEENMEKVQSLKEKKTDYSIPEDIKHDKFLQEQVPREPGIQIVDFEPSKDLHKKEEVTKEVSTVDQEIISRPRDCSSEIQCIVSSPESENVTEADRYIHSSLEETQDAEEDQTTSNREDRNVSIPLQIDTSTSETADRNSENMCKEAIDVDRQHDCSLEQIHKPNGELHKSEETTIINEKHEAENSKTTAEELKTEQEFKECKVTVNEAPCDQEGDTMNNQQVAREYTKEVQGPISNVLLQSTEVTNPKEEATPIEDSSSICGNPEEMPIEKDDSTIQEMYDTGTRENVTELQANEANANVGHSESNIQCEDQNHANFGSVENNTNFKDEFSPKEEINVENPETTSISEKVPEGQDGAISIEEEVKHQTETTEGTAEDKEGIVKEKRLTEDENLKVLALQEKEHMQLQIGSQISEQEGPELKDHIQKFTASSDQQNIHKEPSYKELGGKSDSVKGSKCEYVADTRNLDIGEEKEEKCMPTITKNILSSEVKEAFDKGTSNDEDAKGNDTVKQFSQGSEDEETIEEISSIYRAVTKKNLQEKEKEEYRIMDNTILDEVTTNLEDRETVLACDEKPQIQYEAKSATSEPVHEEPCEKISPLLKVVPQTATQDAAHETTKSPDGKEEHVNKLSGASAGLIDQQNGSFAEVSQEEIKDRTVDREGERIQTEEILNQYKDDLEGSIMISRQEFSDPQLQSISSASNEGNSGDEKQKTAALSHIHDLKIDTSEKQGTTDPCVDLDLGQLPKASSHEILCKKNSSEVYSPGSLDKTPLDTDSMPSPPDSSIQTYSRTEVDDWEVVTKKEIGCLGKEEVAEALEETKQIPILTMPTETQAPELQHNYEVQISPVKECFEEAQLSIEDQRQEALQLPDARLTGKSIEKKQVIEYKEAAKDSKQSRSEEIESSQDELHKVEAHLEEQTKGTSKAIRHEDVYKEKEATQDMLEKREDGSKDDKEEISMAILQAESTRKHKSECNKQVISAEDKNSPQENLVMDASASQETREAQEALKGGLGKQSQVESHVNDSKQIMASAENKMVLQREIIQEAIKCTEIEDSRAVKGEKEESLVQEKQQDEGREEKAKAMPTSATIIPSSDSQEISTTRMSQMEGCSIKEEVPMEDTEKLDSTEEDMIRRLKHDEKEDELGEPSREDPGSIAPTTSEVSKDIDVKATHKKSHNILSGVGSKVKHSISKVKKAIIGKPSQMKNTSPKKASTKGE